MSSFFCCMTRIHRHFLILFHIPAYIFLILETPDHKK
jgi:hypothetical protein